MTTAQDPAAPRPRWGLLAVVAAGCAPVAVAAGFFGLLAGGDFASGGRAPVQSALFWVVSGAAAALPLALLPWLGLPLRRPVALAAAGLLALAIAVAGWLYSAA